MTYRLDPAQQSPFAALVVPLPSGAPFDAVSVAMDSDRPARVSLQFRSADGSDRWRASFVAPTSGDPIVLTAADFVPVTPTARPFSGSAAASLLLVADLVNFTPGSSGRFVLTHLTLGHVR